MPNRNAESRILSTGSTVKMSPWPTDTPGFKPNDDIFKAKAILKRDFLFETKQDRQGSRGGLFKETEETPN